MAPNTALPLAVAALWTLGALAEVLMPEDDPSHRAGIGEYVALATVLLASILPRAWPLVLAAVVLWVLPITWQRVRAVAPHWGSVYLLRRSIDCYPQSRAGWLAYVGSTDDFRRRMTEHQDDRRDDFRPWKHHVDWTISGPAWHTLTRKGAGRLENRTIKLLVYGARIHALPPIENEAATRLRRGPHPVMWLKLKRAKWLDGTFVPARRFYLSPSPDAPAAVTAEAEGPYPDAVEAEWAEDDETSPGWRGYAEPPKRSDASSAGSGTTDPAGVAPSDLTSTDSDSSHHETLPVSPHLTVPSHPNGPPLGGSGETPYRRDDETTASHADDPEPEDDATEGDDLDGAGVPEPKGRASSRKRSGGRRGGGAGRGGASGMPGWVPLARGTVHKGGSVTDAHAAVKAAGFDVSRATVGRWTKDA